jgi:hypothetical protein
MLPEDRRALNDRGRRLPDALSMCRIRRLMRWEWLERGVAKVKLDVVQ